MITVAERRANRVRLLKALQSGQWEQTCYTLATRENADIDSFCVIGVALDILPEKVFTWVEKNRHYFVHHGPACPPTLKGKAGYRLAEHYYGWSVDETSLLITLNDREKRSFPAIAEYLKERWKISQKAIDKVPVPG